MKIFTTILVMFVICLQLPGCIFRGRHRVILPSVPPLSTEKVEQTAKNCSKEIAGIKNRISYVPPERRDEFKNVVQLAERACKEITTTFRRLKSDTYHEQLLRKNLEHAESILVPGASVVTANSLKKTEVLDESVMSNEPLR